MILSNDTKPSAAAKELGKKLIGALVITHGMGIHADRLREAENEAALALDRFRAAGVREERPAEKIANGLLGAIHTTKLAGEIIDLLPPGVATRDLFHQIIAILAPHISEPPHDR